MAPTAGVLGVTSGPGTDVTMGSTMAVETQDLSTLEASLKTRKAEYARVELNQN